ncbi:tyrosine-type recombinase/integrase [Senegalia massiliensis]|uniref:Tyr recombinase domain-containing protein n=1 Tax=Senegalia massiliensis TaxID=1720316 RepID=A0A845QX83_9CLOT|nr:tyrosine-type recombinase/integrase [Senegalia massiliensis]NBI07557.1 hypothetical protein [Senegalia massiliensis]
MKKDIEIKLHKKRTKKLKIMPEFIVNYIMIMQEKYGINTQIAYLIDYNIYLEYLLTLPQFYKYKEINEFRPDDLGSRYLNENDIWGFLDYLNGYKKIYITKTGKKIEKHFSNTRVGKARKLASIHKLYKYLSRRYDIDDITKHIEIQIKQKKEIRDRLNNKEINLLINTIQFDKNIKNDTLLKYHKKVKLRDLCIVLLLGLTGIRVSELIQLDISDISIHDEKMIVIRKSGNQDMLFIPDAALPFLKEYIDFRNNIKGVSEEYKNALFLSLHKKRINQESIRNLLKKYKTRANIQIDITPHTLRRTFATHLLNIENGSIELVAQQLGHSSIETARRFYADLNEETIKKATKNFTYNKNI